MDTSATQRDKQSELLDLIKKLNDDPLVHGILVQLPLPAPIDFQIIIAAIDQIKM